MSASPAWGSAPIDAEEPAPPGGNGSTASWSPDEPPTSARIVFDCRWLGIGGAGRATQLLLQALRADPPPGAWVLWGFERQLASLAFPGARVHRACHSPRSLHGQRELASVPKGDVVLYMHHVRPLAPGCSVTLVHDTIPLRYPEHRVFRLARRAFLHAVVRLSARVLTPSEFSRGALVRDLGVRADRIEVIQYPVDDARARRVAALRARVPQQPVLVYVGRFGPRHKNVRGLCSAFSSSRFAASGGRLLLVGGWGSEVQRLAEWARRSGLRNIEVRGTCSEEELDVILASSRALILPSLEEGYGLPAFEAAAAGLPVAASPTGAIPQLPAQAVVLFDPRNTGDMTRAIDDVTQQAPRAPLGVVQPSLRQSVLRALALALDESEVVR